MVIDANIAQACSRREAARSVPYVTDSIDVMDCLRANPCFHAAFSDELRHEWTRHRSYYSMKWLKAMTSEDRVGHFMPRRHDHLRRTINRLPDEVQKEAADKDVHLIELALTAHRRLLSHDKVSRRIFGKLVGQVGKLDKLRWAGPSEAGCLDWLREGAPIDSRFRLNMD